MFLDFEIEPAVKVAVIIVQADSHVKVVGALVSDTGDIAGFEIGGYVLGPDLTESLRRQKQDQEADLN